jgi:hypothetical protein
LFPTEYIFFNQHRCHFCHHALNIPPIFHLSNNFSKKIEKKFNLRLKWRKDGGLYGEVPGFAWWLRRGKRRSTEKYGEVRRSTEKWKASRKWDCKSKKFQIFLFLICNARVPVVLLLYIIFKLSILIRSILCYCVCLFFFSAL